MSPKSELRPIGKSLNESGKTRAKIPAKKQRAAMAEAVLTAADVPPYGFMPTELEDGAQNGPLPSGFTAATWSSFLLQTRDEIAAILWPYHDGAQWQGRAMSTMDVLTKADLDLLDGVFRQVLSQPAGASGDLALVTHKALFLAEDDMPSSGGLFETMRRYLAAHPPAVVSSAVAAAGAGIRKGMGPRPLAFKRALQRPRPYQMSMALARAFSLEGAKSAFTPSIMSGHSLQGLFAATAAYLDQQQQIDLLPGARRSLAQFGVDFGDRRVFAGVHYPSDNLASWFIALKLAPICFGAHGPSARVFMIDAIRQSRVHSTLEQIARSNPGSPYGPLMQWLGAAM